MAYLWFAIAVLCFGYASIPAQAYNAGTTQVATNCECPPIYSSCRDTYLAIKCAGGTPASGEYNIAIGNRSPIKVYCDMESTNCGLDKGWMRVAELDMTVAGSECPAGLDEGMYGSKKLCGNRGSDCCKSTTFNTSGVPYTEVCGYVAGYQDKTTGAFNGKSDSIDSVYLDGISITRGTPRKHIWSLAAGHASGLVGVENCPCNVGGTDNNVPTFVKNNWYCESGNPTAQVSYAFFPNDVLWDGKQCTLKEPPCCTATSMPYFRRDVEGVTTDNIELRVCHDQAFSDEDVPLESYQFFVR